MLFCDPPKEGVLLWGSAQHSGSGAAIVCAPSKYGLQKCPLRAGCKTAIHCSEACMAPLCGLTPHAHVPHHVLHVLATRDANLNAAGPLPGKGARSAAGFGRAGVTGGLQVARQRCCCGGQWCCPHSGRRRAAGRAGRGSCGAVAAWRQQDD
jgi:hypothetical protein